MKLLNLIMIYSAELIEAVRFSDAGLELLNSNNEENLRIFPFNYDKKKKKKTSISFLNQ